MIAVKTDLDLSFQLTFANRAAIRGWRNLLLLIP
jgi:hypothetical protein